MCRIIEGRDTELVCSSVTVREVAINTTFGREGFDIDPRPMRRGSSQTRYTELAVTGAHAAAVYSLPPIRKDLFDRILIAQALAECSMFPTADPVAARYAELTLVRGVVLLVVARGSPASVRSLLL